MAVAFVMVHHMAFKGQNPGELAFAYLGAFLTLFLAGAGRYSLDAKLLK
jgi:putative oxidoreductase